MTYAYWNNGAPRTARVSGSGNKQRLVLPDGSFRTGKVRADPSIDLYEYVEVGKSVGTYQTLTGPVHTLNGETITATYTAVYKSVEQIRALKIAGVKADAGWKITAILPEYKQRNLSARAIELLALGQPNWTAEEQAEWDAGAAVWAVIKAIRTASDVFEEAVSTETDVDTLVALHPTWPGE